MDKHQKIRQSRLDKGFPSTWKFSQRKRVADLLADPGTVVAYWNSDRWGRPCNGGQKVQTWSARVGLVQEIPRPLEICTHNALHATTKPHIWKGDRVWLVALSGEIARQDDKVAALKREFLGEILPEQALFDYGLALRLGANLSHAHLEGALRSADDAEIPGWSVRNGRLTKA